MTHQNIFFFKKKKRKKHPSSNTKHHRRDAEIRLKDYPQANSTIISLAGTGRLSIEADSTALLNKKLHQVPSKHL